MIASGGGRSGGGEDYGISSEADHQKGSKIKADSSNLAKEKCGYCQKTCKQGNCSSFKSFNAWAMKMIDESNMSSGMKLDSRNKLGHSTVVPHNDMVPHMPGNRFKLRPFKGRIINCYKQTAGNHANNTTGDYYCTHCGRGNHNDILCTALASTKNSNSPFQLKISA